MTLGIDGCKPPVIAISPDQGELARLPVRRNSKEFVCMATGKVNRGPDADLISERREVPRISFSAGQACTVTYNNSQRVLGSLVKKNQPAEDPVAGQ